MDQRQTNTNPRGRHGLGSQEDRVRPTASIRRDRGRGRGRGQPRQEEQTEQGDGLPVGRFEQGEGSRRARADDDDEILKAPHPGGPEVITLLRSFPTHVAAKIWFGEERDILRFQCHAYKLLQWDVPVEGTITFRRMIRRSRMLPLRDMSYSSPNKPLLSAFVERWHPETNTFHMPFGEMTITLDDVYCLLGLPVSGLPVEMMQQEEEPERADFLIERLLGIDRTEAFEEISLTRGSYVRLEWLKAHLSGDTMSRDPERVTFAVRGFLLYTLGCTLFADKTGNKVQTSYLRLLEDLENIHNYAWGTGALAFLYRQLGHASRCDVKSMCGYMPLLEAWIYAYFPSLRPPHDTHYELDDPLACCWTPSIRTAGSVEEIVAYRERLDSFTESDVEWSPYANIRATFPFRPVAYFHGCIKAFSIIEPYHPDRVLRQFGYVQTIPADPLGPRVAIRPSNSTRYKIEWDSTLRGYFMQWDSHLLSEQRRGRAVNIPGESENGYMEWYYRHSHPIVQNPQRLVTNVGRSSTAYAVGQMNLARDLLEDVLQRWRRREEDPEADYLTVHDAYKALGGEFHSDDD